MQRLLKSISPPPKLSISAWADRFRRLSSEASAEPGQWRTSRAEYQRAIMDTISEPGVQRVVLMCSAQVGKTEVVNNVAGFHISHDPAPILVLQPTDTMAETWSKDRLAPMLRDTPVLRQASHQGRSELCWRMKSIDTRNLRARKATRYRSR